MARSDTFPDDRDPKFWPKVSGRRGNLVWRPHRGKVVVQHTPTYTTTASRRAIQRWIYWLKVVNILWHYTDAYIRNLCLEYERATGVPARDFFSSAQRGLLYRYIDTDGGEIVSSSLVERYSRTLDLFGRYPGDIVYRDAEQWKALRRGWDGDVLQIVDGLPAWRPLSEAISQSFHWSASELHPISAVATTLFDVVRTQRLGVNSRTSVSVNLIGISEYPQNLQVSYHWPANSNGTAVLFVRFHLINANGTVTPLAEQTATYTVNNGEARNFELFWDFPNIPDSAIGVTIEAGRRGNDPADTTNGYTYILSLGAF